MGKGAVAKSFCNGPKIYVFLFGLRIYGFRDVDLGEMVISWRNHVHLTIFLNTGLFFVFFLELRKLRCFLLPGNVYAICTQRRE